MAARPRRGQGAGGWAGPLPRRRPGSFADDALEPLKKRLVTAIVVQAQQRPADRDREAGDRPEHLAGTDRQAVSQSEAQHQVGGMVHQVIEIDAVQADRSSPAGDLAVDMVEPETEVGQHDAHDEQRAIAGADRHRGARAMSKSAASVTWCARQAEPDRQPAAVNGRRTGELRCASQLPISRWRSF